MTPYNHIHYKYMKVGVIIQDWFYFLVRNIHDFKALQAFFKMLNLFNVKPDGRFTFTYSEPVNKNETLFWVA